MSDYWDSEVSSDIKESHGGLGTTPLKVAI